MGTTQPHPIGPNSRDSTQSAPSLDTSRTRRFRLLLTSPASMCEMTDDYRSSGTPQGPSSRSTTPKTVMYNGSAMHSYRVKVFAKTSDARSYLWGGAGVVRNFEVNAELLLLLRVDEEGETVTIGVDYFGGIIGKDHKLKQLGVLRRGESFAVELADVKGVYAQCESDSSLHTYVNCTVVAIQKR